MAASPTRSFLRRGVLAVAVAGLLVGTTTSATADPPPRGELDMRGDVGDYVPGQVDDPVHDPTLVEFDGDYFVFSTGQLDPDDPGGVYARRSTGSLAGPWEALGEIPLPDWTLDYGINHLWAPHAVEADGWLYVYYAASSFGTNTSAIGVTRSQTPEDLASWEDLGPVLTSDASDDFNAIDADVFRDRGQWWISWGSFWDGIKLQRLEDMVEPTGEVYDLARHPETPPNPIENPQIFKRGQYYYLLVSWDFCCQGLDSTYRIAMGRSRSVTGPYLDRDGVPLADGGGTILLDGDEEQVGTGAPDVVFDRGRWYLAHHYYDASADGIIRFQVRELTFEDGWPVAAVD